MPSMSRPCESGPQLVSRAIEEPPSLEFDLERDVQASELGVWHPDEDRLPGAAGPPGAP